jgi:hypothetical protein
MSGKVARMSKEKRKRGRPARPMPEPIDADPEDVARALMMTPPKLERDWNYLKTDRNSATDSDED